MSCFRSEAATVVYFETYLTASTFDNGLSDAKFLRIRDEFIRFLGDKRKTFSFTGLKLCGYDTNPILYREKLLKIIDHGLIDSEYLTLHFILVIVYKIFKTGVIKDTTLWGMLHKLLNEEQALQEKPLWRTMPMNDINYLANLLDGGLNETTNLQQKCCNTILHRMCVHYKKFDKAKSWETKYYKGDIESRDAPQNEVTGMVNLINVN